MISIVIPAYNEESLIAKCLEGIANQKTNEKFEVILVDNGSTDKTKQIAQKYKGKINLKIIDEKIKGRGTARYTGFKAAKGEIIFSTDADTITPPNWIDKFVSELKKGKCVAVSGTIIVNDVGAFKNYIINNLHLPFMSSYRYVMGHYWLSGFSFAIYRDAYEKSGGFNPKLNAQEDVDLSFRVAKLGKIRLIKDVPVTFSGRRFKNGIVTGFLPYAKTFIGNFWLNGKDVKLPDIR